MDAAGIQSTESGLSGPIATLARSQYGVVSRKQLLEAGLSPTAVKRYARNGRLISLWAAFTPQDMTYLLPVDAGWQRYLPVGPVRCCPIGAPLVSGV
ncbi:MAG: type IV toxin-antitoxin system AbiEi family antitoxin domain-containing protein [Thermoleophilia bacterium]|nr:type IV toxin-antitoxin system AbiEi family antitoxin domain-containing protein [Thermoleophilia bacterium]